MGKKGSILIPKPMRRAQTPMAMWQKLFDEVLKPASEDGVKELSSCGDYHNSVTQMSMLLCNFTLEATAAVSAARSGSGPRGVALKLAESCLFQVSRLGLSEPRQVEYSPGTYSSNLDLMTALALVVIFDGVKRFRNTQQL